MITLAKRTSISEIQKLWSRRLSRLSCEIEGHPLGGGMLKLEPREAGRVLLSKREFASAEEAGLIDAGILALRRWRHCA
jgi:hypothetical protein